MAFTVVSHHFHYDHSTSTVVCQEVPRGLVYVISATLQTRDLTLTWSHAVCPPMHSIQGVHAYWLESGNLEGSEILLDVICHGWLVNIRAAKISIFSNSVFIKYLQPPPILSPKNASLDLHHSQDPIIWLHKKLNVTDLRNSLTPVHDIG